MLLKHNCCHDAAMPRFCNLLRHFVTKLCSSCADVLS